MPIAHLSVVDAHARQSHGATLVDVRSTREYAAGHPAGALNVPVLEHDEDTGELVPNPDFVRVMKSNFTPDTEILISCQSGVRSVRATQMLEAFGFMHPINVLGGFGGSRDRTPGKPVDLGWAESGLPVDVQPTPDGAYADLLAKADK